MRCQFRRLSPSPQGALDLPGPQETRERLLEAAVIEFAEHGQENATLRDICARAEVNLNAVKYHFQDKQGLYLAAVTSAHAATQHIPSDDAFPPDTTPAEQLKTFIGGLLSMALSDRRETTANRMLVMRELIEPSVATKEVVRSFIKPRFAQLDVILTELMPPDTSVIDRHMMALTVVGQCIHYKVGRRIDELLIAASEYDRFTLPRLTEHITQVTLAAVEAKWRSHESVEA